MNPLGKGSLRYGDGGRPIGQLDGDGKWCLADGLAVRGSATDEPAVLGAVDRDESPARHGHAVPPRLQGCTAAEYSNLGGRRWTAESVEGLVVAGMALDDPAG